MPFTITEKKTYSRPQNSVNQAALAAIKGLEGKILSEDSASGKIKVQFDKKILGKVLGDRTCLEIHLESNSSSDTDLNVAIYPLDAVGQKLKFGARKGVSQTVLNWFYAHLDHHLDKAQ